MNITSVPNGTITFPMLGEDFAFTAPSDFSIFGLTLHWYGAIIAFGFILAYLYVMKRRHFFGLSADDILDVLIWALPAGIIGARLYYVIFNFAPYKQHPLDIFKIWQGGLAIYGAVIGAILAIYFVTKKKQIKMGAVLDMGAFGFLIGQCIGRWGNFMNREAFGRETDIFCRMGLTDATGTTIYVHPTFLYESLWNFVGFILLHIFSKLGKRKYDGQIFAMYVTWYGLGRMLIEGLRTDSLYIGSTGIRVSQLLAALTVVLGLLFLAINGSMKHDENDLYVNSERAKAEIEREQKSKEKA